MIKQTISNNLKIQMREEGRTTKVPAAWGPHHTTKKAERESKRRHPGGVFSCHLSAPLPLSPLANTGVCLCEACDTRRGRGEEQTSQAQPEAGWERHTDGQGFCIKAKAERRSHSDSFCASVSFCFHSRILSTDWWPTSRYVRADWWLITSWTEREWEHAAWSHRMLSPSRSNYKYSGKNGKLGINILDPQR